MTDILISTIQGALLPEIREIIRQELRAEKSAEKAEKYITVNEVQRLCGDISRITVQNWTSKGLLTSYKVGGRRLYRLAEVQAAVEKIKTGGK